MGQLILRDDNCLKQLSTLTKIPKEKLQSMIIKSLEDLGFIDREIIDTAGENLEKILEKDNNTPTFEFGQIIFQNITMLNSKIKEALLGITLIWDHPDGCPQCGYELRPEINGDSDTRMTWVDDICDHCGHVESGFINAVRVSVPEMY